jgi:hypothetical protein
LSLHGFTLSSVYSPVGCIPVPPCPLERVCSKQNGFAEFSERDLYGGAKREAIHACDWECPVHGLDIFDFTLNGIE